MVREKKAVISTEQRPGLSSALLILKISLLLVRYRISSDWSIVSLTLNVAYAGIKDTAYMGAEK